ncbi:MAG: replication protein [Inoviridae sp.]|nr:MAG: replication protein [Inoviridae sp.]
MNYTHLAQNVQSSSVSGAAERPLGTTAKSSSTSQENLKRRERFEALMTARQFLSTAPAAQRSDVKFVGDVYRTHDCKWAMLSSYVHCYRDPVNNAAHYGSLVTCGSVWACPVCASKIQQRRRGELVELMAYTADAGKGRSMVTFTFPHVKTDSLSDLLLLQRDAFRRLRSGRGWLEIKKLMKYEGLVRSLEITHGANGWHPHTHELWISSVPVLLSDRPEVQSLIIDRWEKACISAGLLDPLDDLKVKAFRIRSVDIRWEVDSTDYLAKQDSSRAWGVESELALSRTKKGRAAGVHPHEFLIRQAPGDREKYIELVDTMKKLRTRQLYWSPGLKAACGLTDKTDEELADENQQIAVFFASLTSDQWSYVRGNGVRAHVLEAVAYDDMSGFLRLLLRIGAPLSLNQLNQLALIDALDGCCPDQIFYFRPLVHRLPAPLLISAYGQLPPSLSTRS